MKSEFYYTKLEQIDSRKILYLIFDKFPYKWPKICHNYSKRNPNDVPLIFWRQHWYANFEHSDQISLGSTPDTFGGCWGFPYLEIEPLVEFTKIPFRVLDLIGHMSIIVRRPPFRKLAKVGSSRTLRVAKLFRKHPRVFFQIYWRWPGVSRGCGLVAISWNQWNEDFWSHP